MKRSIQAKQDAARIGNLEKMIAEIYTATTGKDPAEIMAQGSTINTTDGVDEGEATTAGRALRQRRTERTATTKEKGKPPKVKDTARAVANQGALSPDEQPPEATA